MHLKGNPQGNMLSNHVIKPKCLHIKQYSYKFRQYRSSQRFSLKIIVPKIKNVKWEPVHISGTPIIPTNISQCQHLMIFVLSKYMYFVVILTFVFFTRFNDSYMCTYGNYTFLGPMF